MLDWRGEDALCEPTAETILVFTRYARKHRDRERTQDERQQTQTEEEPRLIVSARLGWRERLVDQSHQPSASASRKQSGYKRKSQRRLRGAEDVPKSPGRCARFGG